MLTGKLAKKERENEMLRRKQARIALQTRSPLVLN